VVRGEHQQRLHYDGAPGVFIADFPANPPVQFDHTASAQNVSRALWQPVPGTKVYTLKHGAAVQLVHQTCHHSADGLRASGAAVQWGRS
jgi:hypothetical protein